MELYPAKQPAKEPAKKTYSVSLTREQLLSVKNALLDLSMLRSLTKEELVVLGKLSLSEKELSF